MNENEMNDNETSQKPSKEHSTKHPSEVNHNPMIRRRFLMGSATTAVAALATTAAALAPRLSFAAENSSFELVSTFSGHRGHDIDLSVEEIVKMLRETHEGNFADTEIRGTASHSHTVRFSHGQLLHLLLAGKETRFVSARSNGHTHDITVRLNSLNEA